MLTLPLPMHFSPVLVICSYINTASVTRCFVLIPVSKSRMGLLGSRINSMPGKRLLFYSDMDLIVLVMTMY